MEDKKRIIIVEDDTVLRDVLAEKLALETGLPLKKRTK